MQTRCKQCGGWIDLQRPGRPADYCSNACRQAAYRARKKLAQSPRAQFPADLLDRPQWACSNRKRPITPSGRPASSTDPDTWNTYAACTAPGAAGNGVGMMTGRGVVCIDLDHCLDKRGHPNYHARRVLAACKGAYVERSQSGDGLHIWGYGDPGNHLQGSLGGKATGAIYRRGQFIVVTANTYQPGRAVVLDLDAVAAIFKRERG
ncbi:bifunctional DNA primase/polymerase [Corynebacterium pseudopelargi]|uniref:DNA primase/polymerase bifunctional N-terminal domain-containing protein n=1 Tax=Corynebacterium pseudopelargi TaxID=2080757 RepID=A0A3G6IX03_9CORY|nr:bifunctional DNA primase/polymerase [Corynebacterium pseudopelargi]AZA08640.1 hypothetical protein CPPEL_02520 [Corynebacterium pseudopelargi]